MNRSLREDLINDIHAALGWNRLASEKAGKGRIHECRERCEWVNKSLLQALHRLKVVDEHIKTEVNTNKA